MKINDQFKALSDPVSLDAVLVNADGSSQEKPSVVVREHLLSVFINEQSAMELVCCPDHLVELVLGRLVTEGIVTSQEDIDFVYLCDQGLRCRVFLTDSSVSMENATETVPSCCTGNRVFLRSPKAELQKRKPYSWKAEWITTLAKVFAEGTPLHEQTHGTHSCMLAQADKPLYCFEDLGRHNALDKTVGTAFRDGVDLHETILYTSGRIPVDMMQKVIRAGVPVVVSNAAPTDKAVALAEEYGVTLICRARPGHFLVFTGMEYRV